MNKSQPIWLYARVLCAVAKTGGITSAAEQLEVTPSAISNIISRLRVQYDDALFVRAGATMVPTPKAADLIARLGNLVQSLEDAFMGAEQFDPAKTERSFHLASPDYLDPMFLPNLIQRFRQLAPLAQLTVHPVAKELDNASMLEQGHFDLMICNWEEATGNLHRQRLADDTLVCMARANHPAFKKPITEQDYIQLGHIAPTPMGPAKEGVVDEWLAKAGIKRRILNRVPYFGLIPEILTHSDLVLTTGARFCNNIAKLHEKTKWIIVPCPIALPTMRFYQVWHARQHQDEGHIWFRQLVLDTVNNP